MHCLPFQPFWKIRLTVVNWPSNPSMYIPKTNKNMSIKSCTIAAFIHNCHKLRTHTHQQESKHNKIDEPPKHYTEKKKTNDFVYVNFDKSKSNHWWQKSNTRYSEGRKWLNRVRRRHHEEGSSGSANVLYHNLGDKLYVHLIKLIKLHTYDFFHFYLCKINSKLHKSWVITGFIQKRENIQVI